MCGDEYQDANWDRKSKDDAIALLASLAIFDFIVSFLVLYEFLSHLSGVTVKLQGQSIDIIKAYQEIADVKRSYNEIASKMDEIFAHVYKHAGRVAGRQIHRCNAPADNPEQYYQRNVAVLLINHIRAEQDEQFSGSSFLRTNLSVLSSSPLCLVPSVLCDRAGDLLNADEIINTYKDDLPSGEITVQFVFISFRYSSKPKEDWPNTAGKALKKCDDDLFPNLYALLKICATIPAMNLECEKSANSLRRLHTYNRECMGQERLSSLALMHIHYQVKIDLDEVVQFADGKECDAIKELYKVLKEHDHMNGFMQDLVRNSYEKNYSMETARWHISTVQFVHAGEPGNGTTDVV
ncbi:52 kDa repressor of the inhibitor of the protein kinase-like [Montipora foliosa]|uniref:52 kDa repressor of the inhibitor of the protein kinase-like n=1 Tax=Montipora foliosa TaxID=591990 RepID=UPI0035F2142B